MTSSKPCKAPKAPKKDTQLKRLLRVKDALRTADTPARQEAMEGIIKQYCKQLEYTEEEYKKFREILLRKYPFPPIKKEFLQ